MVTVVEQGKDSVTLKVDLREQDFHVSTSGKTKVTGTGGFMAIQGGLKLSVNVTKPVVK